MEFDFLYFFPPERTFFSHSLCGNRRERYSDDDKVDLKRPANVCRFCLNGKPFVERRSFGTEAREKERGESENEKDNPPDVGRVVQMTRHGAKTESDGGNRRNRERRRTADDSYASDARLPDEKIN